MNREERLSRWVESYSDAILRTCFLYLSDQAQAEDALQDTLIKAWRHMGDYERKGVVNDKAWLMRIAINTCKDYRRTAWFRHIDSRQALDELPPGMMQTEMEDRNLTLMVMDLPDRYKREYRYAESDSMMMYVPFSVLDQIPTLSQGSGNG